MKIVYLALISFFSTCPLTRFHSLVTVYMSGLGGDRDNSAMVKGESTSGPKTEGRRGHCTLRVANSGECAH